MSFIDTGSDKVLLRVDDGIATITFSNPAKRNALSFEMREALISALKLVRDDPSARVVVLTGDGEESFVAGADLSEFPTFGTPEEGQRARDTLTRRTSDAWRALEKPAIAMINGYCIGAGLLMALNADIRTASVKSSIGIPAARLGLGYGFANVEPVVALVGQAWAAEMLFTGRRLTAAEALRIGLVNHVVAEDELRPFTVDLAQSIARNAPLTIAAIKVAISQVSLPPGQRDTDRMRQMVEECVRSADFQEGQRAFAEKRQPRFTGRLPAVPPDRGTARRRPAGEMLPSQRPALGYSESGFSLPHVHIELTADYRGSDRD